MNGDFVGNETRCFTIPTIGRINRATSVRGTTDTLSIGVPTEETAQGVLKMKIACPWKVVYRSPACIESGLNPVWIMLRVTYGLPRLRGSAGSVPAKRTRAKIGLDGHFVAPELPLRKDLSRTTA